ncbi:ATP-dependent RNA helicase, putative [Eimeria maxima]|uniref:ATP-dependent RNA helicase, putative n=1 Tax=Eimeria maxima TaxID=5804 RepID=U6MA53_EIMMA|nr:ATP-dependent RNA helicase, putative [Eimeria maxima]CDJ59379.1 ATP-dependent RNA helicase, putative [Eimeria maxima]
MALSRRLPLQASPTSGGGPRPPKCKRKRVQKVGVGVSNSSFGPQTPSNEAGGPIVTGESLSGSSDRVAAADQQKEPQLFNHELLGATRRESEAADTGSENQDVTFRSLGVCDSLCSVLHHLSLLEPTPVQRCSLPLGLSGHDFCAIAPTGTGKTLCYLLPVLQRIQRGMGHTFMSVVLLPARELVSQVGEQFGVYGQHLGLRWVEVTGGRDMMVEAEALQQQAPHVVLATPGRLADLLQREKGLEGGEAPALSASPDSPGGEGGDDVANDASDRNSGGRDGFGAPFGLVRGPIHERLQAVDCLVLDEADRLLSEEFGPDLRLLLSSLPASSAGRQTLLLSASSSPALLQLQQQFGDSRMPLLLPERSTKCPPLLQHRYIFVPAAMRGVYVLHLLQQEPFASQRGIIFSGSVRKTQQLATALQQLEVDCVCIHSLLQQRQRVAALKAFRSQHKRVLVATDVAARGLDLPNLDFVVNLQPPKEPEVYVHRVGRTARAGRKGLAITFVDPEDVAAVHRVESYIGRRLEELPLPPLGLARVVRNVLSAEAKAAEKLRANGFNQKAEIYETAQREYRRLRRERRGKAFMFLYVVRFCASLACAGGRVLRSL